ncbi:MAG: hypothetical protein D6743_10900 [Calditrichaeota bacterium]|nr:MAG: hypothetical protein D6743_10900 [Calditrichota bacterium]
MGLSPWILHPAAQESRGTPGRKFCNALRSPYNQEFVARTSGPFLAFIDSDEKLHIHQAQSSTYLPMTAHTKSQFNPCRRRVSIRPKVQRFLFRAAHGNPALLNSNGMLLPVDFPFRPANSRKSDLDGSAWFSKESFEIFGWWNNL